jgi:hypothetical protein
MESQPSHTLALPQVSLLPYCRGLTGAPSIRTGQHPAARSSRSLKSGELVPFVFLLLRSGVCRLRSHKELFLTHPSPVVGLYQGVEPTQREDRSLAQVGSVNPVSC